MSRGIVLLFNAAIALLVKEASADCVADSSINDFFELDDDNRVKSIPRYGSCCMYDVCGLACPEPVSGPSNGKQEWLHAVY
jgi:hypothetical protein